MCSTPSAGRPAPGVRITLHEIGASARGLLKETVTNADGRTDAPLIGGEPLRIGTYELSFHIGDYFAKTAASSPPIRRFSTWCRSASPSPSPRGTITCRCS